MNVNELRTNLRHFPHFLSDALKTPLWEARHRLQRLRVSVPEDQLGQSTFGKNEQHKSENHLSKNEDFKKLKNGFKFAKEKFSSRWDSVICEKKAPFNWCCLSQIDVGLWLLERILLASGSHPPRDGEVAARTEKAASFVFQHFLLHILWTDTHTNLMYSFWTDTHTLPVLHHIEETYTADTWPSLSIFIGIEFISK